jgi:hypothetical protein
MKIVAEIGKSQVFQEEYGHLILPDPTGCATEKLMK